CTPYFDYW
nr:immunoglobulin heavy chain junction region [Mus musculus]